MSKLWRLREWLPLDAATTYLSQVLEETVGVQELYALAHDGKLQLSMSFPERTWAQRLCVYASEAAALADGHTKDDRVVVPSLAPYVYPENEEVVAGILDLAMLGGELEFVREMAHGRSDEWSLYFEAFLLKDEDGKVWRPVTLKFEKYLAPTVTAWYGPNTDFVICVRVKELNRVVESALSAQGGDAGVGDVDPSDLPSELQAANIAFRAVLNGYGDPETTFKSRLTEYLRSNFDDLKPEAVTRIATVANPNKEPGRRRRTTP